MNLAVNDPTNPVLLADLAYVAIEWIGGSMYTLEWQMTVNHGVTCDLILPSISSSTRPGMTALSGAFFTQNFI